MSVILYHWEPNANSGKPMLTLAEKGVAYESRYLDLLQFDQHKPAYLAVNPDGTIPAMVHGSRVLTESTPMMEYIDDAFEGPPLKPQGAEARWRMRWWMRFFDAYFAPSLSMMVGAFSSGRRPGSVRRRNCGLRAIEYRSSRGASPGARLYSMNSRRRNSPNRSAA